MSGVEVHAARTQGPGWDDWDARWSGGWCAAVQAGTAAGRRADLVLPAAEHLASLRNVNPAYERHAAVVVRDGEAVGGAKLALPLLEDPGLAHVEVLAVAPDARGRGAGRALADWARATAAAAGRTRAVAWFERPCEVPGERWPGSRFAAAQGLRLALVERTRELALPLPAEVEARLRADVAAHAGGYAVRSWEGPCPDEDARRRMALLHARMSTDAPSGDAEHEEERWDADRVVAEEARAAGMGRRWWTAVAVAPDGAWAAYSLLTWTASVPDLLGQEDTLVLREHRGHRLGLACKLEAMRAAAAAVPGARRVLTGNADGNGPIIALNEALGFRVVEVGEEWVGPVAHPS